MAQIGRELELIAPHALQYGLMPTRMQLLEAGRSDLMAAIQARSPAVKSLRIMLVWQCQGPCHPVMHFSTHDAGPGSVI